MSKGEKERKDVAGKRRWKRKQEKTQVGERILKCQDVR